MWLMFQIAFLVRFGEVRQGDVEGAGFIALPCPQSDNTPNVFAVGGESTFLSAPPSRRYYSDGALAAFNQCLKRDGTNPDGGGRASEELLRAAAC